MTQTTVIDGVPADPGATGAGDVTNDVPSTDLPSGDAPATERPSAELPPSVLTLARAAADQDAGPAGPVGGYLGVWVEDDVALTVRFAATHRAYSGWAWSVTVALVEPERPTVSEVVLLPGEGALVAPAWLPWSERVRPGDLGPGDLLAPVDDDPRVVPAYLESDDPAVEALSTEVGLGRVRVLSRLGRIEATERWSEGDYGPDSDMAKAAPDSCVMCAFYLPVAGSIGTAFGVCANAMSPADGRVVHAGYGCGAHSELVVDVGTRSRRTHLDDQLLDVHHRQPPAAPAVDEHLDLSLVPAADLIEEEIDAIERHPVDAVADWVAAAGSAADQHSASTEPEQPVDPAGAVESTDPVSEPVAGDQSVAAAHSHQEVSVAVDPVEPAPEPAEVTAALELEFTLAPHDTGTVGDQADAQG